MGKKGGDKEKAAAKKAAKSAKQATKAAKSTRKAARKNDDEVEEDIEVLVAAMVAQDAKKTAVTLTAVPRPGPRANFSLTVMPSGEQLLFGGEFNDGSHNYCYNELYRGQGDAWSLVSSPNTPPARCSHQAALVNVGSAYFLYVVGGEFATNLQFYHYNDTWRLDLATNRWEKIESKKGPSARSGHRLLCWRNFLVLFGGFHQSYTQDIWHKDLWVMDVRTHEWREVVLPGTAQQPSARSGMQFCLVPGRDVALLYGGYSEAKLSGELPSVVAASHGGKGGKGGGKGGGTGGGGVVTAAAATAAAAASARRSKSIVHTDLWTLKLTPLLAAPGSGSGALPVWERVRCVGAAPSARLGFSMALYRDRALLFGGVSDVEEDDRGEDVVSTFYGDLYSLDIDKHRWFPLELKKEKAARAKGAGARGRKGKAAASAALAGAGGGDDAASADSEEEEEEVAEEEVDEDAVEAGSGAAGAGGGGEVDDDAFYYYSGGKLVRVSAAEMAADAAEEDAKDAAAAAAAASSPGAAVPAPLGAASLPLALPVVAAATAEAAAAASASAPAVTASSAVEAKSTLILPSAPSSSEGGGCGSETSLALTTSAAVAAAAAPTAAALPPPPPPAPCPRMKASLWVEGHWAYVYGGMFEGRGGRETTLDDLWRLDLRTRTAWECVLPARLHDWAGEVSDDDEEEEEDSDDGEEEEEEDASDADYGDSDSGSESGDSSGGDEGVGRKSGGGSAAATAAAAAGGSGAHVRGHGRAGSKEDARIRALRARLGLEDAATTPAPGERLGPFFARTAATWVAAYVPSLAEGERIEGKQLRRRAFALARTRYDALWPVLEELYDLEETQRQLEEARSAAARLKKKTRGGGGSGGKRAAAGAAAGAGPKR